MKLTYSPKQIKKVAKFIWKNNPYAEKFATTKEDLADQITGRLLSLAKEGGKIVASRGFCITLWPIDEETLEAEVLVDAAVGSKRSYKTVSV
jgi:hypothetical protein